MCEPLTMGLMMGGMMGLQVLEQVSTAGAMRDQADTELAIELEAQNNQIAENDQKAALDRLEAERATLRTLATARVNAGESGIGGNSVLRELMATEIEGMDTKGIIETNRKNANRATRISSKASAARYQGRLNYADQTEGTWWGNALKIGGAGVSGYVGAKGD